MPSVSERQKYKKNKPKKVQPTVNQKGTGTSYVGPVVSSTGSEAKNRSQRQVNTSQSYQEDEDELSSFIDIKIARNHLTEESIHPDLTVDASQILESN